MSGSESGPSNPQAAEPTGAGAAPPAPTDLVEFVDVAPAVAGDSPPVPIPPAANARIVLPGPGLPEALGWTALVLAAQVGAMTLLMAFTFAYLVIQNGGRLPTNPFDLEKLEPNAFALLSGLPALIAYLVLIPLACWRMSPNPLRKLNFSQPSLTQVLIVCSCVLPLGFVSDALYTFQKRLWQQFLDQFPALEGLRDIGLDATMSQLNGASLPLLLFLLAVVPAVGEEWMLRGLVGRGLVARWGVVTGVLFTSILFAVMHLDPPHVAAVFPIGVMMHLVYLATRSFWMPIAYHFLNNATVSVFTSLGAAEAGETSDESLWFALIAIPYLVFAVAALWKLRTRYIAADGREPDRGYFSFEHRPESEARRIAPNHLLLGAIFGALLAAQIGSIAVEAWEIVHKQGEEQAAGAVDADEPPVLDEAETATAN